MSDRTQTQTVRSRKMYWTLTVSLQMIDITSEYPTLDEFWRFTDKNGHEHYYENGYPTLRYVVDAEHWCDGREGRYNHDEHMAVDAYHYECEVCGVTVKPTQSPAYAPKMMPGMYSGYLRGIPGDDYNQRITIDLTHDQLTALMAVLGDEPERDALGQSYLDNAQDKMIRQRDFSSNGSFAD